MKKHEFNIFPEMSEDEFNRLKADMQKNGFDQCYPIMQYDNAILDGWNRYRACTELKITPFIDHFAGTDEEALAFVMRSNKRRNLSDERLTALALQSDDMMKTIQKQVEEGRKEKLIGNDNAKKEKTTTPNSDSLISKDKNQNTTDAIIADTIGVKRNQVEKIKKLKKENPDGFEKVAAGKTTTRKLNAEKKAKLLKEALPILTIAEEITSEDLLKIDETEGNTGIEIKSIATELTDEEILELVMLARMEVKEIAEKIVTEGADFKSQPINLQHFQAIEKIQIELGQVLTCNKNLKYGKAN
jgi:hypothetical protein